MRECDDTSPDVASITAFIVKEMPRPPEIHMNLTRGRRRPRDGQDPLASTIKGSRLSFSTVRWLISHPREQLVSILFVACTTFLHTHIVTYSSIRSSKSTRESLARVGRGIGMVSTTDILALLWRGSGSRCQLPSIPREGFGGHTGCAPR